MKNVKMPSPPSWAIKLLTFFCREEYAEEIEGDLTEVFYQSVDRGKTFSAKVYFVLGVFSFLKPYILKIFKPTISTMLYLSYLKLAYRNLFKRESYGLINILGLSVGFCAALFMGLYVLNELNYDRHFADHDNIYRVVTNMEVGEDYMHAATTPMPLGVVMKNEIPEVQAFGSFFGFRGMSFEKDGMKLQEQDAYLVSNSILEIFDIQMISGDTSAFSEPGGIVFSESKAMDYFGSIDILNETIKEDRWGTLTVRGVFKDQPTTSHFRPEILANPLGFSFTNIENWGDINTYTYVKLKGSLATVEGKLPSLIDRYMAADWEKNFGGTGSLTLQKLTAIHLHSNLDFEIKPNGKVEHVYAMAALAIFILIVVGINYINMSTARATSRLKEIAVRKVLGSVNSMIKVQFIVESLLTTIIAAVLSVVFYVALLSYFNGLTGMNFSIGTLANQQVVLIFFGVVSLVGIVGAWYPAGFVSRFKSLDVFRSNFSVGGSSLPMSKFLNAIQFSVALVMIVITLIIHEQMQFMKDYDLGYDKDHIMKVDMKKRVDPDMGKRLKNELLSHSDIKEVTIVKQAPGERIHTDGIYFEMPNGAFEVHKTNFNTADESFLATLGIELLAGRNFDLKADESARAVLVNETLVRTLGYSSLEEILSKKVALPLGEDFYGNVVGVMKDFHLESLHKEVQPLIVVNFPNISSTLLIQVQGDQLSETLKTIDDTTREIANSDSFVVTMLDQSFWSQYQEEELRSELMTLFSVIIILMAFIGLFGLVSYSVEQKVKEMTVRKIFGADFINILGVYFKAFVWVFVASLIIGVPMTYYLGNLWLMDFAYRIDMPHWFFVVASLLLLGTTSLIIILKSRQSHNLNPAERLRDE